MTTRPYLAPHLTTLLRTLAELRARSGLTDADLHRLVDDCARGATGGGDPEVMDLALRLAWLTRVASPGSLAPGVSWERALAGAGEAARDGETSPVLQALPWLGGESLEGMLRRALAQGRGAVELIRDGRWELVSPDDLPLRLAQRFAAVWEARTLLDRSRWKQAAQAATRAIDAVGWDGQAFAHRARARLMAGDATGACADAEALLAVAWVEVAVQVRGEARERLGRDPGPALHAVRGANAVRRQRNAEAAVLYKRALDSFDRGEPAEGFDEVAGCLALAGLLTGRGRHDAAAELAARAVKRDPSCEQAWRVRRNALVALGDDAGVSSLLDACIEAGAAGAWTWFERAERRLARGELEAAWEDARRAVEQDPELAHQIVAEANFAPLRAMPGHAAWLDAALARAPSVDDDA